MNDRAIDFGDRVHTPLGEGEVLDVVHHGKSFVVGLGGRKIRRYRRDQITSLATPLAGWRPPERAEDPLWPLEGQTLDRDGMEAETGVWSVPWWYEPRRPTPPAAESLPSQGRPDKTQPSSEDEAWLRLNEERARAAVASPQTTKPGEAYRRALCRRSW